MSCKNWKRWEKLALLGLILVFAVFGTYKIHSPGLYSDEMLFVAAATGKVAHRSFHGVPLMIYPVIGALKSWIYIPIFALFGVSAASVRVPVVLISCGTLALWYALVRRKLSSGWAMAFTGACVVHPGFVLQARVDWGPVVLMLFFKGVCLYLLVKWLETPRFFSWSLAGAIAACGLGFFDKFNFVWFVVALSGATLVVYWKEIRAKLKEAPKALVAGMALAIVAAGALVIRIVLPLMQAPQINWSWFSSRVSTFWMRYEITTTGVAMAGLWFKKPPRLPFTLWPGWIILAATAGFLILTLPSCFRRSSSNLRVHSGALRFCVWCLIMFAAIFVQIVLTPQAGGPHHMLMLFPLDLLACFAAAFVFVNSLPVRGRYFVTLLGGTFLLVWVGFQFENLHSHLRRFRDINSFKGLWSPRVEQLANYLNINGKRVDAIYPVDCCMGYQLGGLCEPDIGRKLRGVWPIFKNWSAEKPDAEATVKAIFSPQEKALYVTYTEKNTVFAETRRNFLQMNVLAGNRAHAITVFPPALGEVYQVFESGTGPADKRIPER
jgi:4-amino-4-deoxy-L-arabinose transferase-like glycosyltransferase